MKKQTMSNPGILTDEELEKACGGYVVYHGLLSECDIVDDKTGDKLGSMFWEADAKFVARQWGVSDRSISVSEYERIFGKSI